MINGFGAAADIEKERAGIEKEFGVKALYSPADMTKPAEIAAMIKTAETHIRLVRHAGQQRRHPARRADRGIPDREVGPDHRDQPVGRVSCDPRRDPRHEGAKWGRIISTASAHSLVASPFKVAYVAAKHGIAGMTKTVALEARDLRHHLQLHLAGLRLDAAGRASRSPTP